MKITLPLRKVDESTVVFTAARYYRGEPVPFRVVVELYIDREQWDDAGRPVDLVVDLDS